MSRVSRSRRRTGMLLAVTGASAAVASLFSPARDHGVIDVIAVGAASGAYAYLTLSLTVTDPPKRVTHWLGGDAATRRTERRAFLASGISGALYVVTIWFSIIRRSRQYVGVPPSHYRQVSEKTTRRQ